MTDATWGHIREVHDTQTPIKVSRSSAYLPLYNELMLRMERTAEGYSLAVPFATLTQAQTARASLRELARNRGRAGWLKYQVNRVGSDASAMLFVRRGAKWGQG